MKQLLGSRVATVAVTAALAASLTGLIGPMHSSTPVLANGADKIGISAAVNTWINQNQQPNSNSTMSRVLLASSTFSTSTTEDLVMNFSTECGIYTAVGAKNNNQLGTTVNGTVTTSSTATGRVIVWLELDGHMLPVSQNATSSNPTGPGNGPVSFCSRAFNLSTQNLSAQQAIQLSLDTLDANSFQWFALNVGNGTHTLNVYANLVADTASSGTNGGTGACDPTDGCAYTVPAASALVGQRTLEVFPDHLANTASF